MTINEAQSRIQARVWQAIAQTELDLSALDKETTQALVDLVTEAALLEVDDSIGSSLKQAQTETAVTGAETVLWEGRPFLSLTLHYTLTSERIRITEGLLGKARENIELIRIQDMDYAQTFSERLLNLGDLNIRSHDPSHPEITLKNIKDPEGVYETLRRAVLAARKKHNLSYREEM